MKTMYNLNVITTQFLAYGTDRVKGTDDTEIIVVYSFRWYEI